MSLFKNRTFTKLKSLLYIGVRLINTLIYPYVQLCNMLRFNGKLRILVYHKVYPVTDKSKIDDWCVSAKSFSEQMNLLSSGGYNVLSVDEALRHLQTRTRFPAKAVCVTFDDGYQNNYQYAFPALVQYRITATFYVTTEYLGTDRPFAWIKPAGNAQNALHQKPLNWQEIAEMRRQGIEFASHSHTHPDFSKIDHSQIKRELLESRRLLSKHLDSPGNSFVCPYGIWGGNSGVLKELLRHNGYSGSFLGKWGAVTLKTDRFDLPRIIIYGEDSINTFKRKIDGAYDWFGFFHAYYHYLRLLINRRGEKHV